MRNNKSKCISCGKKICKEEPFCLICDKLITDEYINDVVKDGI
jgi:hypothetical protein